MCTRACVCTLNSQGSRLKRLLRLQLPAGWGPSGLRWELPPLCRVEGLKPSPAPALLRDVTAWAGWRGRGGAAGAAMLTCNHLM